jgi:hypothetical protein
VLSRAVTWFFTSFLRKIAGFNSETRASCDYTRFFESKMGRECIKWNPALSSYTNHCLLIWTPRSKLHPPESQGDMRSTIRLMYPPATAAISSNATSKALIFAINPTQRPTDGLVHEPGKSGHTENTGGIRALTGSHTSFSGEPKK